MRRSRLAHVAIVGYTNAGKSTLLNALTDAGVLVEDRLFATLDATTRRLDLPGGEPVLLSDTVGFIKKLPHGLVEAFKSTIAVAADADLLVHLVDASAADPDGQMEAVRRGAGRDRRRRRAPSYWRSTRPTGRATPAARLVDRHPGSVALSARTGEGTDGLLRAIADRLRALTEVVELLIPYDRGDLLAAVHREGEVLSESHLDDAVRIRARLDGAGKARFASVATAGGRQAGH